MAQNIVPLGLLRDVLQKDTRGLNELYVDIPIVVIQNANKMFHHVLLAEQIEIWSLVLFRKDNILSKISNNFDVKVLIPLVDFHYVLEALYQGDVIDLQVLVIVWGILVRHLSFVLFLEKVIHLLKQDKLKEIN